MQSQAKNSNHLPESAVVHVPLSEGRAYSIHIGSGLLRRAGEIIAPVARSRRIIVISQPPIARRWAEPLFCSLKEQGFHADLVTYPAGERFKNLATMARLYERLYNFGDSATVDRKTLIVALGGGVVGDMAGFLAASYLRGMDYVQIPTTLLAMVDSSVGGKTGVDFKAGKNLIGAFHQPRAVIVDTDTLSTLPAREFRSGMAEVVKYGVIADPELMRRVTAEAKGLRRHKTVDPELIAYIVRRSCEIKAKVVVGDEREETGLRAILNYGHTVGHALEAVTNYRRFKHGEAIAIGMAAAAMIGEMAGVTPMPVRLKITDALTAQGLPVAIPGDISLDAVLSLLGRDKKAVGGKARFVLARAIGDVALMDDVDEWSVRGGVATIVEPAAFKG